MVGSERVVFRVRALIQAHPLSSQAHRYVNAIVAQEGASQPQPEIGEWAGYALTTGYCLRRFEEVEILGLRRDVTRELSHDEMDDEAGKLATDIRTSGARGVHLFPEEDVVVALDALIAGEIERRLDQWRDTVSAEAWHGLEEYIAWWVVKGYAVRVVETVRNDVHAPAEGR
jgi:hypothetical protein